MDVSIPSGFPVAVRTAVATVDGERTDLICSKYEDGVFLIATQIGAFGTVLRAKAEAPTSAAAAEAAGGPAGAAAGPAAYGGGGDSDGSDEDGDGGGFGGAGARRSAVTYSTTVLLGRRDEPLLALAARQLVEAACAAGNTR